MKLSLVQEVPRTSVRGHNLIQKKPRTRPRTDPGPSPGHYHPPVKSQEHQQRRVLLVYAMSEWFICD